MPTDWRVQVATVIVDGIIVVGVLLLLGLNALDKTVAIALLGPLIGARAAVHKANAQQQPTPASVVGNAGGAVALVFAVTALLRVVAATKGHVVALVMLALVSVGMVYTACNEPLYGHLSTSAPAVSLAP